MEAQLKMAMTSPIAVGLAAAVTTMILVVAPVTAMTPVIPVALATETSL